MSYLEGTVTAEQRARKKGRFALGTLVIYEWLPDGKLTKTLCMVVGVWSWNTTNDGSNHYTDLFNVDPQTENVSGDGYLLLPSGRSGWVHANFGTRGSSLVPV